MGVPELLRPACDSAFFRRSLAASCRRLLLPAPIGGVLLRSAAPLPADGGGGGGS